MAHDEKSKEALNLLMTSPVTARIIMDAHKSPIIVNIYDSSTSDPKNYIRGTRIGRRIFNDEITWNSELYLMCGNEIVVPPFISLFHEIYHSYQNNDTHLLKHLQSYEYTGDMLNQWSSPYERDAVLMERVVSKNFGYPGRNSHRHAYEGLLLVNKKTGK